MIYYAAIKTNVVPFVHILLVLCVTHVGNRGRWEGRGGEGREELDIIRSFSLCLNFSPYVCSQISAPCSQDHLSGSLT